MLLATLVTVLARLRGKNIGKPRPDGRGGDRTRRGTDQTAGTKKWLRRSLIVDQTAGTKKWLRRSLIVC